VLIHNRVQIISPCSQGLTRCRVTRAQRCSVAQVIALSFLCSLETVAVGIRCAEAEAFKKSTNLIVSLSKSCVSLCVCVCVCLCVVERGADYEFRLSAKNAIDYGPPAIRTLRTPDGSQYTTHIHIIAGWSNKTSRPTLEMIKNFTFFVNGGKLKNVDHTLKKHAKNRRLAYVQSLLFWLHGRGHPHYVQNNKL